MGCDPPRLAWWATTLKTGQLAPRSETGGSSRATHRGAADGSGYTFVESFPPHRATRAREVPGFDSLGFQPLPQDLETIP